MADQQELNKLPVKSDSLPNNWLVTLVNPVTGAVAENMTVARFIELLPFLLKAGGMLDSALRINGAYSGTSMLEDDADVLHIGNQYGSGFAYISYGVKYKAGSYNSDIISTIYFKEDAIYFMYLFASDGIYLASTAKTKIPVGTIVQNFAFRKIAGASGLSAYSLVPNDLTETITDQVPVSNSAPMTLAETGEPTTAYQEVERYEYSVPKMAEAILKLQEELDTLKGR